MQERYSDATLAEEPWVVQNAAHAASRNARRALDALAQGYIYPALAWAFEAGREWAWAKSQCKTADGLKVFDQFYSVICKLFLCPTSGSAPLRVRPEAKLLLDSLLEKPADEEVPA